MSIYPVRASKWFTEEEGEYITVQDVKDIVASSHCVQCGKTPKWRYAIIYHALPWGYNSEVWCTQKCYNKYWREKKKKNNIVRKNQEEFWKSVTNKDLNSPFSRKIEEEKQKKLLKEWSMKIDDLTIRFNNKNYHHSPDELEERNQYQISGSFDYNNE